VLWFPFISALLAFAAFAIASAANAAPHPAMVLTAKWNGHALTVKGKLKQGSATSVDLYDGSGRLLGQAAVDAKHRFKLARTDLARPESLCTVQAEAGEATASVAVKGRPKVCAKTPSCQIISPLGSVHAAANTDVSFRGQAALNDPEAGPLKMEWDFGGGSMGQTVPGTTPTLYLRPTGTDAKVQFIRDNGRYRVRFMAWDKQQRFCEDSVEVVVGNPPDTDPGFGAALPAIQSMAQASQQSAPASGSQMQGKADDWVVLPYQDWTMQTASDAKTMPNITNPLGPPVTNINALVYQKARKPVIVDANTAALFYSSASNPVDPVGPDSINTTSQNWPVGAPLLQATVQKSDWFDSYVRPSDQADLLAPDYISFSYAGFLDGKLTTRPDEGFHNGTTVNTDHGRYMPGIDQPYQANVPQEFSGFDSQNNAFAARLLPVTDIDDAGRVNPNPLFRIEARNRNGTVTATDLAISSARDMRCRTCHLTGGIGSNPAYAKQGRGDPLVFHEPASDSLFDLEYSAIGNTAALHSNVGPYIDQMEMGNDGVFVLKNKQIHWDGPIGCANANSACHSSVMQTMPFGLPLPGAHHGGMLASTVHGIHADFFYSDEHKTDIARTSQLGVQDRGYGVPLGQDWSYWDPKTGSLPNTLFPVKDANGQVLPMEQNCLLCHGGLREQSYRDRMYTAGVTCYQCHGDVTAVTGGVSLAHPNPDGSGSHRPWIDAPDCGACHTGNANRGKSGTDGFYSAGVMKTAFDEADRSASPRQPDPANPDEIRFAVPVTSMKFGDTFPDPNGGPPRPVITKARLYRASKDVHGQVPCAACHGAAHGIWPMRDPNSNDNVTSLQLQGHTGPIAECQVCHTADSFAKSEDLDEGAKVVNALAGVLGGPHNMHPVYDPNWWKGSAEDDTPNTGSGRIKGGWHNDYAKKPGHTGEDQCAACHGNDHKGTRLSKTPVDREFVTAKGRKIKVAAGTPIGCDLCHSIEKSCTGSPAGGDCGHPSEKVASAPNRKPVITSASDTPAVFGDDYQHTVAATDPEGHPLTYSISQVEGATIDGNGVVRIPTAQIHGPHVHDRTYLTGVHNVVDPHVLDYYVTVSDDQGGQTTQLVRVIASCPQDLIYDMGGASCTGVTITSFISSTGLNPGDTFRYAVKAQQRSGQPLSYSLQGQPDGMTIDASGVVEWTPQAGQTGPASFTVIATGQRGAAQQRNTVTVCAPPLHWYGGCVDAVAITSKPFVNAVASGEAYHYRVIATDWNNLPLTFSLSGAPDGMTLSRIDDHSARIDWRAQSSSGNSTTVTYTVRAEDGQGGMAEQAEWISICVSPDIDYNGICQSPIQFPPQPQNMGAVGGDHFTYQAAATHLMGLPISYGLSSAPEGMTINPQTGQIDWVAVYNPDNPVVDITITATDNAVPPATAGQFFQLNVCEAGMRWDNGNCQGPVVIDPPPVLGVDAGAVFTYQVVARNTNGGPFTLSLMDAPDSMTIDANGVITYQAPTDLSNGDGFSYTVVATDGQGRQTMQGVNIVVCGLPTHWDNDAMSCQ